MFSPSTTQAANRQGAAPSIVSSDVAITGILQSEGDIQIDGRVDGNVRCARLVVGESGVIIGEVEADTVTVRGRVEGSIRARALTLAATARVEGDVLHRELEVESGAFIQGHFRHSADPLAESLPETAAETAAELVERRRAASPMRSIDGREAAEEPDDLRAAG
jgi:cytoskeletal protein CcmA (bactofilin family)